MQLSHVLNRYKRSLILVAVFGLQSCASNHTAITDIKQTSQQRELTVLHINDVYRVGGLSGGNKGGLARVRALRAQLQKSGAENVLLLHGGDFLFPSPMSKQFEGLQMIDTLNQMNGSKDAYDELMFAVFGNHEFDRTSTELIGSLEEAVKQSRFNWVSANVNFIKDSSLATAENIMANRLVMINGIKVGIFGITTDVQTPEYAQIENDYVGIAEQQTKLLRQQGAEVVVGLTHLPVRDDKLILGLAERGPDVIFGGHEHHSFVERVGQRLVVKADADAISAAVVSITLSSEGEVSVSPRFEQLDANAPVDPDVSASIERWQQRFSELTCKGNLDETFACLDAPLAKLPVELVGETQKIRRYETNLGNWLADVAREKFSQYGAQAAFINSGTMRLNQNLPAGSEFSSLHLAELLPYSTELVLLDLSGAELQKVVDHAVEDWGSNGWWLQVSGLAYKQTPSSESATQLSLITDAGLVLVKADDRIKVVTTNYLLNPKGNQDGYDFLTAAHIVPTPINKIGLASVLEEKLANEEISIPKVEGRICNQEYKTPCIFD